MGAGMITQLSSGRNLDWNSSFFFKHALSEYDEPQNSDRDNNNDINYQ